MNRRATSIAVAGSLALAAMVACGGPPEERAGAIHFTGAGADPPVNRVILAATDAVLEEGEIELAVRVEAIDRLFGGTLVLSYPASEITMVAVAAGELVGAGRLVTTLGTGEEVAGELAIGFVLDLDDRVEVSGDLARLRLAVRGGASAALGFVAPRYGLESRQRTLIAEDGIAIAGVRWFGGRVVRDRL